MVDIDSSEWKSGLLSPSEILSNNDLIPLTSRPSGNPIWKSNNPEQFTSDGWLMQNSRDGERGSRRYTNLSGSFAIYLFHINKTPSNKFLHLLATNPGNSTLTLSGRGSMLNNREFPLPPPPTRRGKGQSYQVARDWLNNSPRVSFNEVNIQPAKAYQIDRISLSPGNMVDGRFELTASNGVFIYNVISSTGNFNDAVNLSQRSAAQGIIASPGRARLGREGGIARHSLWSETITAEIPVTPSYLGLELNTRQQTTDYLMRLGDSSFETFGNYGHKYDLTITLTNSSNSPRNVRLSFASNDTSASVGSLYNGPIRLNNRIIDVLNTPSEPSQTLQTFTVNPSTTINISLEFYIPGLITIGQQLILESMS